MDQNKKSASDLFGVLKSWIPWRAEPANVSRDFWMPDHSCSVCYECDSEFTLINRRHHCRLCGRIFCARCTANSIPAPCTELKDAREEPERIRVCNFCFKQWEQGIATTSDNVASDAPTFDPSSSPSGGSFASSASSRTAYCSTVTLGSVSFSMGRCEQLSQHSSQSVYQSAEIDPYQSAVMDLGMEGQGEEGSGSSNNFGPDMADQSLNQFGMDANRFEYEDDAYSYRLDSKSWVEEYYDQNELEGFQDACESSHSLQLDGDKNDKRSFSCPALQSSYDSHDSSAVQDIKKAVDHDMGDECEASSSLCAAEDVEMEPVDFENNKLLWLPPEPENEEDEKDDSLVDDDYEGDASGEFRCLRTSSSFGSGDFNSRDKSTEDHKQAMKNIVDGHFRALVSQLLQVENIPVNEDDNENWLEIITSLSWEAATILKPDMSRGGGMDPGGYVKVKCVASGRRSESIVVKGVVCKKNVAHRRMTTRIEKPRLMILGGALEYQRVSNHLSSVDTLLKQEMDHLKMAVAKIDAHNPNLLLVEKSVSRFAQDCILEKDISLVLNVKRPLLDRIARCTGAQIVPSVDHLSSQKIGYCESFHVDRFVEEHGSAGEDGKKLSKTLMFLEGCPKPLGCTIILRGANGDELKKVKGVIQYGVFAAYHLALEISFLADEGASLPELPLKEPITVALPSESLGVNRSISLVPGFALPANHKSNSSDEPRDVNGVITPTSPFTSRPSCLQNMLFSEAASSPADCLPVVSKSMSSSNQAKPINDSIFTVDDWKDIPSKEVTSASYRVSSGVIDSYDVVNVFRSLRENIDSVPQRNAESAPGVGEMVTASSSLQQDAKGYQDGPGLSKEEFPPSPSDNQSILVSLSSRCVLKGTVCERSHLFRIKYYGSFDKPLGRYLQDHLFDQSYRCRSCEMPSDAHVQCYTHRQGTLTISVKRIPEILLPGEREGKIWMWHRCLRCPRTGGNPPATRRVVMSDAAWGLSFGKFLELSFSNHAAASRVASCGHSLHRDCLRFYGSGKMVACFRYASIDVHSVFLPPFKLDFNNDIQDWIKKEADELVDRAEVLFSEMLNALTQIVEKKSGGGSIKSGVKTPESRVHVAELEEVLQHEKAEFEETLRKTLNREVKQGQPVVDILELNRLRRQLLFQSYLWDNRLVHASKLDYNSCLALMGCSYSLSDDKSLGGAHDISGTNMLSPSKGSNGVDPLPVYSNSSGVSPRKDEEIDNCLNHPKTVNQMQEVVEETKSVIDEDIVNNFDCEKPCEDADDLDSGRSVRRTLSDSQFSFITNLSDTLDAAWTGKSQLGGALTSKESSFHLSASVSVDSSLAVVTDRLAYDNQTEDMIGGLSCSQSVSISPAFSTHSKSFDVEDTMSWLRMPFRSFYSSLNKNFLGSTQKLDTVGGYNPVYVSSFLELEQQSGGRLHLPVGVNDTVIPVFDDEPTSIIAYALVSPDYHTQLSDEGSRPKEMLESTASLPVNDLMMFQSFASGDDSVFRSVGSLDDSFLSMSASQIPLASSDPLLYSKSLHARVSFSDCGPYDKTKYTVTCYYAKQFDALRKMCCPSELDFVRSLSRCKKWGAQGGKSNVFFAKSLDDRFIIKQVTKTELESFIKFAPEYFKYLTYAISTKSPTCLAKILGIYQVSTKNLKGGKEIKMDVLVMENLLYGRKVTRLYDLKGSARSRYNPDVNGSNKVLLDQNLIEAMPTSPIFVGNKAKRLLERAVWNDTAFLASVDVMDYSLLVGVDEEKHELVLGIIDFMRQYTWDKHLETWVKASGILGGPKNASPTVISPKQYKKRFRKAMTTYFLMVPDQWSPHAVIIPSISQGDLFDDSYQTGKAAE